MLPTNNNLLYYIFKKICSENELDYFFIFKNTFFPDPKLFKIYLFDQVILNKEKYISIYVKAKKTSNILKKFILNFKLKKALKYNYDKHDWNLVL